MNWKESHVKLYPVFYLQQIAYILNFQISSGFLLLFMYILCTRPFGVHIPVLHKKYFRHLLIELCPCRDVVVQHDQMKLFLFRILLAVDS